MDIYKYILIFRIYNLLPLGDTMRVYVREEPIKSNLKCFSPLKPQTP